MPYLEDVVALMTGGGRSMEYMVPILSLGEIVIGSSLSEEVTTSAHEILPVLFESNSIVTIESALD